MAVREGDIIYIRARATNRVKFYENGTEITAAGRITACPITKDGEEGDYINVPQESVASVDAMKVAMRKMIERDG